METLFPGLTHAPNLHPLAVHFPIVLWLVAAGAWGFAVAFHRDRAWRFGLWLHTLGLAGAGVAIALGFWATEKMGHDSPGHDLIHLHRDIMLIATGLALFITLVGWWRQHSGRAWRIGLTLASALLVAIMAIGADRGAELVFRYGVGVAGEPAPHSDNHSHVHGGHPETEHDHVSQPPAAEHPHDHQKHD
jgi:uncharacterized membrane protein